MDGGDVFRKFTCRGESGGKGGGFSLYDAAPGAVFEEMADMAGIVFVLEGTAVFCCGEESRALAAGDMLCFRRGLGFRLRAEGAVPVRVMLLRLAPEGGAGCGGRLSPCKALSPCNGVSPAAPRAAGEGSGGDFSRLAFGKCIRGFLELTALYVEDGMPLPAGLKTEEFFCALHLCHTPEEIAAFLLPLQ